MREEEDEAGEVTWGACENRTKMNDEQEKNGGGKWNAHKKVYAAIHTAVTFQPLFHITISSIRSWSQNIGPAVATKRLKLSVVVGMERGSREERRVGFALRGLVDRVGIMDGARRSWGRRLNADFVGDIFAVGVEEDGEREWVWTSEGGGWGREVWIVGARRMVWDLELGCGCGWSRVAEEGMSM